MAAAAERARRAPEPSGDACPLEGSAALVPSARHEGARVVGGAFVIAPRESGDSGHDLVLGDAPSTGSRPPLVSNEGDRAAEAHVSLTARPDGDLELLGDTSGKLSVPAHGSARLLVHAHAKRAGHAKLEAKLASPGEDETVARTILVAAPEPRGSPEAASDAPSRALGRRLAGRLVGVRAVQSTPRIARARGRFETLHAGELS